MPFQWNAFAFFKQRSKKTEEERNRLDCTAPLLCSGGTAWGKKKRIKAGCDRQVAGWGLYAGELVALAFFPAGAKGAAIKKRFCAPAPGASPKRKVSREEILHGCTTLVASRLMTFTPVRELGFQDIFYDFSWIILWLFFEFICLANFIYVFFQWFPPDLLPRLSKTSKKPTKNWWNSFILLAETLKKSRKP